LRKLLKAKIHRGTVTGADLHYEGSITIDKALMEAVDIADFEAVWVWNISNGQRAETYALPADAGSGEITVNGAAARLFHKGDHVIIASFSWIEEAAVETHQPKIIVLDERNQIESMK